MTNDSSVGADPGADQVDDATIVVNAGHGAEVGDEAGDETIVSVSDYTVVVTRDETVAVANDETVAVTNDKTVASTSDHTVMAARDEEPAAGAESIGDETVVVTHAEERVAGDGTIVVTEDATVVSPIAAPERRRDRRAAVPRRLQESAGSNPAPPIEDTYTSRDIPRGGGVGLDAERPIAPAPGTMPWDPQPTGERGLSQGLPVSYGARTQTEIALQDGIDEAQRRVGPVPENTPVYVVEGRSQLPSLERKDRLRKRMTLAIYGGVIVACIFGLWGVAAIAFG